MPRPSTRILHSMTRRMISAVLLVVVYATSNQATAGPIADRINQWSAKRQASSRVEKPFSGQSSNVEINQASITQKLRNRLSLKPKADTTTHRMKTEKFNHNQGMLSN